jgi:acetyl-CoA carboxylase biotin carboxylase subunit
MFRSVLIANRGEIARRVIRACRKLGIEAIAVYSEADAQMPFVAEADRAICIGPPRARDSYLDMDTLLQAAIQTEAQAIHPGYGFLSENALFATRVQQSRIGWIGPPPRAIRLMGEKAPAKAAMRAAGLPMIPGSDGLLGSVDDALAVAAAVGYPVLLKADAGGGGRGMRRADEPEGLRRAWDEARNEAISAFGDGGLYLERYLEGGRHIEFQVLADAWGNAIHVFERECSVQRRHQKLIEEAPSPALSAGTRAEVGARVASAVAAIGYEGAGTIEFLLDRESGALYFIEMNTRLQVEHPVTEEITGLDLVEAQIRIAAGEKLWIRQDEVRMVGHAVEVRVNAEDPSDGFRPSPGTLASWGWDGLDASFRAVPSGKGRLRLDAAVESGTRIPPHYDSLLGKAIAWGPDRATAIDTLLAGLSTLRADGVPTTIPLHRKVLDSHDFRAGDLQVGVIPGWDG